MLLFYSGTQSSFKICSEVMSHGNELEKILYRKEDKGAGV